MYLKLVIYKDSMYNIPILSGVIHQRVVSLPYSIVLMHTETVSGNLHQCLTRRFISTVSTVSDFLISRIFFCV